jgi:hypothetical protein
MKIASFNINDIKPIAKPASSKDPQSAHGTGGRTGRQTRSARPVASASNQSGARVSHIVEFHGRDNAMPRIINLLGNAVHRPGTDHQFLPHLQYAGA